MLHSRVKIYLHITILCLLIMIIPDLIFGLQDVSIIIPSAVRRGENAIFICNYDLENDTLYTVKWYKGRREFFRYTPKEKPSVQVFASSGINVERTISNQSHIVLPSVQFNASGKYRCEVSADAPSFHTEVVYAEMEVVEIPTQYPIITGIHTKYRLGDIINGNCSSDFSKPAANLTWTINDIRVNSSYIKTFKGLKNPLDEFLEAAILEINFIINPNHFNRRKLILKCTASIYDIYQGTVERVIEEDRPMILASGRHPDINLYTFNQDNEMDETNEYLLHKGNLKSIATSLSSQSSILRIIKKIYEFTLIKHQRISIKMEKKSTLFDVLFIIATIIFLLIPLLTINNITNINMISLQFRDYKKYQRNKKKNNYYYFCYSCCCYFYYSNISSFSNQPTCKHKILRIIRIIKIYTITRNDCNKKFINKNDFCVEEHNNNNNNNNNNKKIDIKNYYNYCCISRCNCICNIYKNFYYYSCDFANNKNNGKSNKLNFMAS